MKLSDLLTSTLGQLRGRKQYGIPLIDLLQSQIAHDPTQQIRIEDADGRGSTVILLAKGKEVKLLSALQSAIASTSAVELDVDRDGGLRVDSKGLTVTVSWRKRTSAERIKDVQDRVESRFKDQLFQTPAGRLAFPHLIQRDLGFPSLVATDKKKARHAANYATGDLVEMDFSELEQRLLGQYVGMGFSAAIRDGRVVLDVESIRPVGAPINCRCAVKKEAPKPRKSIELLPTSLKQSRRESSLPQDFLSGGGLQLKIVGSSYRPQAAQAVLRSKNPGNMVLIAHEPDNAADPNALAVFTWKNGGTEWTHVGYVQAIIAEGLSKRLARLGGGDTKRVAFRGSFVDDPAFGGNPTVRLEQVWYYPGDLRA